ncbi:S-layer homology domain-containing protein (plasmid) [Alkalihalophilus pseudofirmus]|uniref:S-layer homology domain-containing protein n=1 Tax=Alkalihalophilus pseudofirmus TaxID=79885 RepID=UPI00259B1C23|nr:S-layer homology domain-containing protein [Alkalihalophilus pseudofirmus]WEG19235.1 S-layer homology domain-containing protein [Alkalihalophilus pseudofirmus]
MNKPSIFFTLLIVLTLIVTPVNAQIKFPDVANSHWGINEITYLSEKGIINGYPDGRFGPTDNVTRGDAAIMIAGALGLELTGSKAPFNDVPQTYYAHDAISAVAAEGIIGGYRGNYSPRDPLTRGQMAAILQRAFNLSGTWDREFKDVANDHLFYSSIQAVASHNITVGYPDLTFKPSNHTQRAEFSAFLARTLEEEFRPKLNSPLPIDDLEIHHLDVGQGDSTLIIAPNGRTILIDAGTQTAGQQVVSYLKQAGITTIDHLIITHAHADHVGGAVQVMSELQVNNVIDSGIPHTSQTYLNYLTYIDEHNIPFEVATVGDSINIDPSLDIIVVNSGEEGDSLNDASVSLHLTYDSFTYLITGDAEETAEHRIVEQFNVQSDVLRVGHHGSRTSTTPYFLTNVLPQTAIISVGEGNSYGHPHPEVLDRLKEAGVADIFTTIGGNVIVYSDGNGYTVDKQNGNGQPGSEPIIDDPIDESPTFPININTAGFEELQYITGVGDVIAQRIIDYRQANGPFQAIAEIKNVSGIGDATFERMKDQITVH